MNVLYSQDKGTVLLTQQTYVNTVVEKFGFSMLLPKSLPMAPGIVLNKECGKELDQPS
jgi:hypothetical protein